MNNKAKNNLEIEKIKKMLMKSGDTIAVAESVTGGLLQATFSQTPDASQFFQGGITAYNLGQKARHLKVNSIHAEQENSVSKIVAEEMAMGVCALFSSSYGISITGYAARLPEKNVQELFAFAAIARDGKIVSSIKITVPAKLGEGLPVQMHYIDRILKKLLTVKIG